MIGTAEKRGKLELLKKILNESHELQKDRHCRSLG